MRTAARTDRGQVRPSNEDFVFTDPQAGVLIIADGMGGHAAGEVASELATRTIAVALAEAMPESGAPGKDLGELLRNAIGRADAAIRARTARDRDLSGMGCTVVAAVCGRDAITIAHVGDSRAYLINGQGVQQLTEDHSVVAQMLNSGFLTPSDARKHHLRNVITRSLGYEGSSQPDIQQVEWHSGDILLLCTDGLSNVVEDVEIAAIVASHREDLEDAARDLIDAANARGGPDNISVILALNGE
jgi:serine/threonine protein phosphatase PrpC